jgi:hypothetical protein
MTLVSRDGLIALKSMRGSGQDLVVKTLMTSGV